MKVGFSFLLCLDYIALLYEMIKQKSADEPTSSTINYNALDKQMTANNSLLQNSNELKDDV